METWGNDGGQTVHGSDFTFLGLPRSGEWNLTVDSATLNPDPLMDNWLGMDRLYPAPEQIGRLTGTVGFYTSYYFIAQSGVDQWNYMERPFTFYYEDSYGISHYDEVIPEEFDPTSSVSTGCTPGVLIKAKTTVEDGDSIYNLQLRSTGYQFNGTKGNSYSSYRVWVYIPSMSIISTETSAELEGLENIADSITAGNNILSAMYGDIMELLNRMYARMGDMLAVEEAARDYLSSIAEYTQDIDYAVWEIYNLVSSQFDLLISTIELESDDIQAAIAKQTQDMINYLDQALAGAVSPGLDEDIQDIDDGMSSINQDESGYQSTASERFEAITGSMNGLPTPVLPGVSLLTMLFTRVWDSFGVYIIVYTFPLTLGVCLLVLGRISRFHQSVSREARSDAKYEARRAARQAERSHRGGSGKG